MQVPDSSGDYARCYDLEMLSDGLTTSTSSWWSIDELNLYNA
jgi:hypothetical protein